MRGLSDNFMTALKGGLLYPVLERIKNDDTLMLAIRDGYINIYYRGGNLLRITENIRKSNSYDAFFDKKYDLSKMHKDYKSLQLPPKISNDRELERWILSFRILKELMDFWFNKNSKLEREIQQFVERENNRSPISGETEYFVTDIEFADSAIGARFDILAIKWPATGRKDGKNCSASFIEIKYGDNALGGNAGLIKHIKDINKFLLEKRNYSIILDIITKQFNQLDELGLIKFKHSTNNTKVQLSVSKKPEFILLFANHNPRSKKLKQILSSDNFKNQINEDKFNLKFFVNTYAGYGMHNNNILSYDEFIRLI